MASVMEPVRQVPHGSLWRDALLMLAVTLILLAPALAYGSPFAFYDTAQYFDVGERIASVLASLFHQDVPALTDMTPVLDGAQAQTAAESGGFAAMAGGRSPAYSILLYAIVTTAGPWLLASLQALACAFGVVWFVRTVRPETSLAMIAGIAAVLSIAGGLGFHAAFLMPDVFAGCLLLLLFAWLFVRPGGLTGLYLVPALILLAATFHASNVLLVVAAALLAMGIEFVRTRTIRATWLRAAIAVGLAVAALAISSIYGRVVQAVSGDKLQSAPYLVARIVADGPGARLIEDVCTKDPDAFAACAFQGIVFETQDQFLWDGDGSTVSFSTSSSELKARLQAEQMRFVIAAIMHDPIGQIGASFTNFREQVFAAGVKETASGSLLLLTEEGEWPTHPLLQYMPDARRCAVAPGACSEPGWFKPWNWLAGRFNSLVLPAFLLGAVILAAAARRNKDVAPAVWPPAITAAVFLGLMALANAAICGILSGAHDRYQTRLLWTLTLALIMLSPYVMQKVRSWRHAAQRSDRSPAHRKGTGP